MNLFDAIERQAAATPHCPALIAGPLLLSYQRLLEFTAGTAQRLRAAGIGPGDVVVVRNRTPVANLLLVLAALRVGAVSAHAPEGEELAPVLQRYGARALLGAADLLPAAGQHPGLAVLDEQALLAPPPNDAAPFASHAGDAERPWRIASSSGTTGVPKACLWSHGASDRNMGHALRHIAPFVPADRVLCFQSVATNFGLHFALWTLACGAALVLPKSWEAAELALCLDVNGPTAVVMPSGLAVAMVDWLQQRGPAQGYRFPTLGHVIVGGEALSPHVLQGLRTRVCPRVHLNYGCTEAGLVASADADFLLQHPEISNRLLPGTQAEALGADGTVLPPGQTGLLRIRVPGMASGYLGDAALTAAGFGDGWYHTGDTGSVTADGLLTLGVRASEMLDLDGRRIDPLPIEGIVNRHPGVRESAVFVLAGEAGARLACLYTADQALQPEALARACEQHLGAGSAPQFWVRVTEIPRAASGKISRSDLARRHRQAADGSLLVRQE